MNKAEALWERYKRDLEQLQDTCPHEELSEFRQEWWAPGHSTGRSVQVCQECNKVIHSREGCSNCLEWVLDGQGFRGDGQKYAFGATWCSEACAAEAQDRGKKMGFAGPVPRHDSCRRCGKRFLMEEGVKRRGFTGLCSDACAEEYVSRTPRRRK